MISFKQFITEARMAPLYHGTHMEPLTLIIEQNVLKGKGTHRGLTPGIPTHTPVVSLTRNFQTAMDWKTSYDYGGVLELDQQKLSYNYKIQPVEIEYIWSKSWERTEKYTPKSSGLFEEFVIGDIKPLSRYLTAIHITDKVYKRYKKMQSQTTQFDYVLNHPLLKVDGKLVNK